MDEVVYLIGAVMVVKMLLILGFYLALKKIDNHEQRAELENQYATQTELRQAEVRADSLLSEVLTNDEYYQLRRRGYLEVFSPSNPARIYRVPRHRGRVQVFEDGKSIMTLCVQPTSLVPDSDVILMHKLMIEGNEQEYLQLANRF